MRYVNFHLIISSLLTYILHVSDGCSRKPARPQPTPSTRPPSWKPTTPVPPPPTTRSLRGQFDKPCNHDEYMEAACLHGGTCYVIELLDVRSPHCQCDEGWTGIRCERLKDDFFVKRAGIATGVVAAVIIIVIIIVYLIVKRRKMRKRRQEERNQANGHVCKSLIQEGTVVEYPPYDYTANEKSETNV